MTFTPALIRPFWPNPAVEWRDKLPLRQTAAGYTDPEVAEEFRRFVYRDLASVVCGLVFGVGGAAYSALIVWHVRPEFRFINYAAGALAMAAAVLDVYFLSFGAFTVRRANYRAAIAVIYALICINVTSYGITGAFATCDDAVDYLGKLYDRPAATPERMVKYCAHATNPYVAVCLGVAFSTIRLAPPVALALSLLYFLLFYVGYAWVSLPGETTGSLIAKLVIYVTCVASSLALNVVRFTSLRRQFELSINATVESQVAMDKQEEVETLLSAMVPGSVLARITAGEVVYDRTFDATVLFSDIVSFTQWSSSRSAGRVVGMLNSLCVEFDRVASSNGVEKVKTIGDAYWAVVGIPDPDPAHAHTMCSFAATMIQIVRRENNRNPEWGHLRIRVGVDSGPVEGAIFGEDRISYEVFGEASDRAHLCEQHGEPMKVCIGRRCFEELDTTHAAEPHKPIEVAGDPAYQLHLLPVSFPTLAIQEFSTSGTGRGRNRTHSMSDQGSLSASASMDLSMNLGGNITPRSNAGSPRRLAPLARHESSPGLGSPGLVLSSGSPGVLSAASPASRVKRVKTTKDAEKQREQFLAARMERRAEMAEGGAETLESIEQRYSERQFNWVLMHFADPQVEAEFQVFGCEVRHGQHVNTRASLIALCAAVLASFFIQGAHRVPGPVSYTLMALALVASVGLTAAAVLKALPRLADAILFHGICVVLILGCGLASGTGTSLAEDTVAGNDLTYMHAALTPLLTFGTSCLPSLAILVLNFVCVIIPIAYFVFDSVTFTADVGFLVLSLLFAAFGAIISEKLLRRQFLEDRITRHHRAEQQRSIEEQRAILTAILPAFVIPEVLSWLGTGFDPNKGVVRYVRPAVVAFLQLEQPPISRAPSRAHSVRRRGTAIGFTEPSPVAADPSPPPPQRICTGQFQSTRGAFGEETEAEAPFALPSRTEAAAFGEHLSSSSDGGDLTPAAADLPIPLDRSGGENHWLLVAHRRVDHILAGTSRLIKIKTIGDLVLLAGPFPAEQLEDSRDEAIDAEGTAACVNSATEARKAADEALVVCARAQATLKGPVRAGIHVGSFIGTVLGTSRLCFDIFGDGVNTASRTLSSSAAQIPAEDAGVGVAVTEDFMQLYCGLVHTPRARNDAASDYASSAGFGSAAGGRSMRGGLPGGLASVSMTFGVPGMLPAGPLIPEDGRSPFDTWTKRDASRRGSVAGRSPQSRVIPVIDVSAPGTSPRGDPRARYEAADDSGGDGPDEDARLESDGTAFSRVHQLTAKGKGSITVRTVLSFPERFAAQRSMHRPLRSRRSSIIQRSLAGGAADSVEEDDATETAASLFVPRSRSATGLKRVGSQAQVHDIVLPSVDEDAVIPVQRGPEHHT